MRTPRPRQLWLLCIVLFALAVQSVTLARATPDTQRPAARDQLEPPWPTAAAPGDRGRALSLEEALSLAEANVPALVRAGNELRLASARRPGAALWLTQNPFASLLVGQRREVQDDGTPTRSGQQYALHVEQSIEVAGQRRTRLLAVDAAVAVAQAGVSLARVEARALTRAFYVQAALADRRVIVQVDRAAVAAQLLESAAARLRLGAANAIDVNLARIEIGRVEGERRDAEVERESRLAELRTLTGLPENTALRLSTAVPTPPGLSASVDHPDALVALALAHRADLLVLRRRADELQAQRSQLRREVVPSPVLSFDLQRDLPGQLFLGGTIGLSLPLWNRNQGPLAQVAAAEQVRVIEERLLLTRVRNEIALAHRALGLRREELRAYEQQALVASAENVDLLRRGWQAGKFDLFRVIIAVRERADIRIRYYSILERLWLARIDLERAVGTSLQPEGEAP